MSTGVPKTVVVEMKDRTVSPTRSRSGTAIAASSADGSWDCAAGGAG